MYNHLVIVIVTIVLEVKHILVFHIEVFGRSIHVQYIAVENELRCRAHQAPRLDRGTARYCAPHHQTEFEPSIMQSNGIL